MIGDFMGYMIIWGRPAAASSITMAVPPPAASTRERTTYIGDPDLQATAAPSAICGDVYGLSCTFIWQCCEWNTTVRSPAKTP